MKKIVLDLNVILDMLTRRYDHEAAIAVFDPCAHNPDHGLVCTHEVTTLAYFLGKDRDLRNKRSAIVRTLLGTRNEKARSGN